MRLREFVASGGPSVGGWCSIPAGFGAELIARAGFDWVCVDTQHGLIGYESMAHMMQALAIVGTPGVVRVAWNAPSEIMKALDAGAQGVIVPLVNTADDARLAVSACRYAPDGQRSFGPIRAAFGLPGYSPQSANADTVCIVQIETREAVHNLPDILSVPGVDVAYVGPADLAVSYGFPPTFRAADMQHREVIAEILEACRSHGVLAGIHCTAAEDVLHWMGEGFGFITAGSDRGYMATAINAELGKIESGSKWRAHRGGAR